MNTTTLTTFPALGITLAQDGDRFIMTGPTGEHSLAISATNDTRLRVHLEGFVNNTIKKLAGEMTDWDLLVATLSPTQASINLETTLDKEARARCDGFGSMSIKELEMIDALFDWSHVRDSSKEAIASAAAFIRKTGLDSARARS